MSCDRDDAYIPSAHKRKPLSELTDVQAGELMQHLAKKLEQHMPPHSDPSREGKAFFLLVVFDEPQMVQFTSNADTDKMDIAALRDLADQLEKKRAEMRGKGNRP